MWPVVELVGYTAPKLTKLEEFVWLNGDRSHSAIASELNRSEGDITRAYDRAHNKKRELAAIQKDDDARRAAVIGGGK